MKSMYLLFIANLFLWSTSALSQEKLEIGGAIIIGNSEDPSPSPGTIRWNDTSQDFEGFTGTAWKSLTRSNRGFTSIHENHKINASDATANHNFGSSVCISGDYALVGALDDDFGINSGSAYIFKRHAFWNDWNEIAKLTASDPSSINNFGTSVSLTDSFAIIGAKGAFGFPNSTGSAYIFQKPLGEWVDTTETAKITASDAAAGGEFGFSVSASGDYVVIGSPNTGPGSAYVFRKPPGGWVDTTETAKITASDGSATDLFGRSVSISGDYIIVGAMWDDDGASQSGSAYIFQKPSGGWTDTTEIAKISASDAAADDNFGFSVSISGSIAIVGAPNNDGYGSAYIFEKPPGGWADTTEIEILFPSDPQANGYFGESVSISGTDFIVGASGVGAGSAYICRRDGDLWNGIKITASDAAVNDYFGRSVSISGNFAIVGAIRKEDGAFATGASYIFVR